MLILWYLKDMPYVVDIAMNGEEAVELFRTRRYDAVLMDIQMPVMDGIAATRLIRETEREQGLPPTPIISLSANTLQEDEQMCIEAGSTWFLAKPVKRSDLLLAVERSIHLALSRYRIENIGSDSHRSPGNQILPRRSGPGNSQILVDRPFGVGDLSGPGEEGPGRRAFAAVAVAGGRRDGM
jgi:CheY-like chemotaxis protein